MLTPRMMKKTRADGSYKNEKKLEPPFSRGEYLKSPHPNPLPQGGEGIRMASAFTSFSPSGEKD
jgi:hypothetical protein